MSEFIFPIHPPLIKGVYIYYLEILDIFRDVKTENRVFGLIQKNTRYSGRRFAPGEEVGGG